MRSTTLLGPWVRRFLLEHLVVDRNLARNTQISYRDTLVLLLPFLSRSRTGCHSFTRQIRRHSQSGTSRLVHRDP